MFAKHAKSYTVGLQVLILTGNLKPLQPNNTIHNKNYLCLLILISWKLVTNDKKNHSGPLELCRL